MYKAIGRGGSTSTWHKQHNEPTTIPLMWWTNNNTKGVNDNGGYMVMKGVQQHDELVNHHVQGYGDGGSTSSNHMQW
jgi:hypothetical protein